MSLEDVKNERKLLEGLFKKSITTIKKFVLNLYILRRRLWTTGGLGKIV